jgi:hypothetical protein
MTKQQLADQLAKLKVLLDEFLAIAGVVVAAAPDHKSVAPDHEEKK